MSHRVNAAEDRGRCWSAGILQVAIYNGSGDPKEASSFELQGEMNCGGYPFYRTFSIFIVKNVT